jgi:hypothetical protein
MTDFVPQSESKHRPCCPNHGEPLEGLPFPIPSKGKGKCPISGVDFEFEIQIDEDETKVDKFGKPMKDRKWNVEGEE